MAIERMKLSTRSRPPNTTKGKPMSSSTLGDDLVSMLTETLRAVQAELAKVTASNALLAEQVRALAEKVEPAKIETAKERRTRLEMQAIRAISDVGPCVKDIAALVGVPENTLHGWPVFKTAIRKEAGRLEAARKQAQEDKENDWSGQSW